MFFKKSFFFKTVCAVFDVSTETDFEFFSFVLSSLFFRSDRFFRLHTLDAISITISLSHLVSLSLTLSLLLNVSLPPSLFLTHLLTTYQLVSLSLTNSFILPLSLSPFLTLAPSFMLFYLFPYLFLPNIPLSFFTLFKSALLCTLSLSLHILSFSIYI